MTDAGFKDSQPNDAARSPIFHLFTIYLRIIIDICDVAIVLRPMESQQVARAMGVAVREVVIDSMFMTG
jgi:hypothetical protein